MVFNQALIVAALIREDNFMRLLIMLLLIKHLL